MREVLRFWNAIPLQSEGHGCYRLVDQRPGGSSETRNGVLEAYLGRDAMGDEQWRAVEPEQMSRCIDALLDQLAVATVTVPVSTEPEPGCTCRNDSDLSTGCAIHYPKYVPRVGASMSGEVTMLDVNRHTIDPDKLVDMVVTRLLQRVTGVPR